jgi:hypothetical protein
MVDCYDTPFPGLGITSPVKARVEQNGGRPVRLSPPLPGLISMEQKHAQVRHSAEALMLVVSVHFCCFKFNHSFSFPHVSRPFSPDYP